MASPSLRGLFGLIALALIFPACDSTDELSDITVNVSIEGSGSGEVEGRTVGVNIQCNVVDGVVSGTCASSIQDRNGGIIRLEATPTTVTNFDWGGDCRGTVGRICELSFTSGADVVFNVVARFEAKTVRVVITPKPITLTAAGEDGAVIAQAQALDENDAEVFGVNYTWESSDETVATVTPLANNRSATVIALKNGSSIITATAQGITGQSQVDVSLPN